MQDLRMARIETNCIIFRAYSNGLRVPNAGVIARGPGG